MPIVRGIATLAITLAAAFPALADDDDRPLDLVGTWTSTGDYAAVMLGAANDANPEFKTPTFMPQANSWSMTITEQQGRAFHGVARAPNGHEEPIVGVISRDNDHVIIAAEEAGVFGEVLDDDDNELEIEFCYQDQQDGRAAVACYVARKQR